MKSYTYCYTITWSRPLPPAHLSWATACSSWMVRKSSSAGDGSLGCFVGQHPSAAFPPSEASDLQSAAHHCICMHVWIIEANSWYVSWYVSLLKYNCCLHNTHRLSTCLLPYPEGCGLQRVWVKLNLTPTKMAKIRFFRLEIAFSRKLLQIVNLTTHSFIVKLTIWRKFLSISVVKFTIWRINWRNQFNYTIWRSTK